MRSTQAMRDRLRELSKPDDDDYDRAVICVLDDFEELERYARSLEKLVSSLAARIETLEAALREIIGGYDWCMANQSGHIMPSIICEAIQDARAALDKEAG